jgi:carboxymethylenebutenolidase
VYESEITVETPGGPMAAFVARPDGGGAYPFAVLFHDGVGYREQVKETVRRFAAGGYECVAPDLFHCSGDRLSFDPARLADPEYRAELMRVVSTVIPDGAVDDADAALAAIGAARPIVCVGYCMGARFALRALATRPGEYVAAACIHPSALRSDDLAGVRGELLVVFAEVDQVVTGEMVDEFREELEAQGVDGVVERWPGTHGFAMADLAVYDRELSERQFERTLELWGSVAL